MVAKKCGGQALCSFLESMICSNLPIAEMLQPLMQIRLSQRPANDLDASWQSEMRERLLTIKQLKVEDSLINSTQYSNKLFYSSFNIFYQLQILRKELILLREDFSNRSLGKGIIFLNREWRKIFKINRNSPFTHSNNWRRNSFGFGKFGNWYKRISTFKFLCSFGKTSLDSAYSKWRRRG